MLFLFSLMPFASSYPRTKTLRDGSVLEKTAARAAWRMVHAAPQKPTEGGGELLMLTGPAFASVRFDRGEFIIRGKPLIVRTARARTAGAQTDGDTGRSIWDGSVALAKFIEHCASDRADADSAAVELVRQRGLGRAGDRRRTAALELGAGTGIAGLAAAAVGMHYVALTDLEYCLPTLRSNAEETVAASPAGAFGGSSIAVHALDWLRPSLEELGGPFTLVLGADVVWLEALVAPFVATLALALRAERGTVGVLAHQTRAEATDSALFAAMRGAGLRWERVALSSFMEALPAPLQILVVTVAEREGRREL